MTLVVDIGNSRMKWARAGEGRLFDAGEASHLESSTAAFQSMADAVPDEVDGLLATNVAGDALQSALVEFAANRWGVVARFVTPVEERYGIRCSYSDPSRLGADRWVALIAAHRLTGGAAGVIDAGTTVTLDAVDAQGKHLGGLILAGPRIIATALHQETSGIGETGGAPHAPDADQLLGTSTEAAVANGAMLGLAGAVDRAVGTIWAGFSEQPTVYITGGDAMVVAAWLETETQYRANLVLEGLAFIVAED